MWWLSVAKSRGRSERPNHCVAATGRCIFLPGWHEPLRNGHQRIGIQDDDRPARIRCGASSKDGSHLLSAQLLEQSYS